MEEMRSRLSEFLSTVFVFTVKHSLALKEQLTQKMKHSARYLLALIIHRLMKRRVKTPKFKDLFPPSLPGHPFNPIKLHQV